MLLTQCFSSIISCNFYQFVLKLGQYIAGDEKLWGFTGNSGNIRLCISKPDRIGFWFYQLCAIFSNGLPYLLKLSMHDSTKEHVPVASIVKGWIDVVKSIGQDSVPVGQLPNPKCFLSADSYYMAADSRALAMEAGIKFSFSCKPDRFKNEVKMVHPPGHIDKTGEWKGIYNEGTGELFVYHYDTQKGVGIKYNYSKGFIHSMDKAKIKLHANRIPGYDNYKTFFEACDNFNRALHDRYFPHKRGGNGVSGEDGEHNDFIIACVLQNTFNSYHHINDLNPKDTTFQAMCDELSDDIFQHSFNYPL
jgi:hypothetical protein